MPEHLSANQLVAYNLMRVRTGRGLSQEQARALLKPYGLDLSKAAYSAAERSYDGTRVRQFDADDLTAMSLAFGVPATYFFLPPRPEDRKNGPVHSGDRPVSWRGLYDVMYGGGYAVMVLLRTLELPLDERPVSTSFAGVAVAALAPPPMAGALAAERQADAEAEAQELAALTDPLSPTTEDALPGIAAAIVTSDRGVLITKRRDGTPPYGFVTGEIEPGETAPFAAAREVKEETGLEVEPGTIIGERVHPKTHHPMTYVAAKPVRPDDLDVFVGDKSELAEVMWVDLPTALDRLKGLYEPVREYLVRTLG